MPDGDRAMRTRGENNSVAVRLIDRAGCIHTEFLVVSRRFSNMKSLFFRLEKKHVLLKQSNRRFISFITIEFAVLSLFLKIIRNDVGFFSRTKSS